MEEDKALVAILQQLREVALHLGGGRIVLVGDDAIRLPFKGVRPANAS